MAERPPAASHAQEGDSADAVRPLLPPPAPLPNARQAGSGDGAAPVNGARALPGSGALMPPAPGASTPQIRPAGALDADTHPTFAMKARPILTQAEETHRLARRNRIQDEETERLARGTSLSDETTTRLAHHHPADQETERLSKGQLAQQIETERLAHGAGSAMRDYTLPIGNAPGPVAQTPSSWDERDEEALQEETQAALALFSIPSVPSMPSHPSSPSIPDSPSRPGSMNEWAGDETLAVVRALRVEMGVRTPLWRRALALAAQPVTAIMLAFAAAQALALALGGRVGAAPGEAASISDGLSALRGNGLASYVASLTHVTGAPLWQVIAAAGYLAAGALGARVIAVACATAAGLATASAARNLFGPAAGIFTALLYALSGLVIYFARVATPDQLALAGVAVSFWAITQATESRRGEWLIIAAIAFGVGVIAQFSTILLVIPLVGVTLALRGRATHIALFATGLVALAIALNFALPGHASVLTITPRRSPAGWVFSAHASAAGLRLFFDGAAVWGLAVVGWIAARGYGRLAVALVVGMLTWPVALALTGMAADAEGRVLIGFVFALPLASMVFVALWDPDHRWSLFRRGLAAAFLLAVAVVGVSQARALATGSVSTLAPVSATFTLDAAPAHAPVPYRASMRAAPVVVAPFTYALP